MPKKVDPALVDEVERLFVGRASAFASQQEAGGYQPVRDEDDNLVPLTRERLLEHLQQRETYGFYLVREDNRVRVCCFDIDREGAPKEEARLDAEHIHRTLRAMGIRENAMCLEFSGFKGYHVWVFFGEWLKPSDVLRWAQAVLKKADIVSEIYPKGDLPEGGFGNLVKLPGALHKKNGGTSRILTPRGIATVELLQDIIPLHHREIRTHIVNETPPAPPKKEPAQFESDGSLLPCARHIRSHGEGKGARNYGMFALAVHSRRAGMDKEQALDVCEEANARFDPPMPQFEVKRTVQSAYRLANPGFDCTQEFLHIGEKPHCSMRCPRYQTSFGNARTTNKE